MDPRDLNLGSLALRDALLLSRLSPLSYYMSYRLVLLYSTVCLINSVHGPGRWGVGLIGWVDKWEYTRLAAHR